MRMSIMQPYFLPHIGYFQLIAASDAFVVYDNIKYTKKGWINRNRFLMDGDEAIFSVPLVKASDSLDVRERVISSEYDRKKLLRRIESAYRHTPQFSVVFPEIVSIIDCKHNNLFEYINYSIYRICRFLDINTKIIV